MSEINDFVDFWFYDIGVNPIPVFSKNKDDHTKPLAKIKWTKYQTTPLDSNTLEEWKSQNLFKDGIGIIGGYVWRGKNKGKYLIMVDCDNQKGIDELFPKGLKVLLEKTLVEQHKDRLDKIHVYFYSDKPIHKKSVSGNEEEKGHPAIEIKSDGKHGIHIVSPSIHKNGEKYEIVSITKEPGFIISLEERIQRVCDKFGIKYLNKDEKFGYQQSQSSKFLSLDFRVGESEGRRPALLSVCGHWFWERQERLNDEETYNEVLALSVEWNKLHCTVSLTDDQIRKQCSDALKKAKYYYSSGEMYPLPNCIPSKKKTSKKQELNFYDMADELLNEYNFISHISKEIYYYSDGIYHKNGDKLIRKKCRHYWESDNISTGQIMEIENIIRDKTMILQEDDIFDDDYQKLIVKNGMYDFDKMEFVQHSPDVSGTIKHPIFYDSTKKCPKFDAFLDSCFDGDVKIITQIWEMMALCFIKKPIIQKGYVNYGIGSNGKTTFLTILRNMLGIRNTTSIPMQQFQKGQFVGYELRGKSANISGDGGTDPITKTGFIKSVLGGDAIKCEEKYRNPFDFVPFTTLIFTFNELPHVNDSSDGFARKIQTIHWKKRFYGDNADPDIDKLAYHTDERSGIFNKLIPVIKRLIDTRKLQYEDTVQETKSIWLSRSDSFFKFKNEHIVMGSKHRIEINRVRDYYKEVCDENGMTPVTDNQLFMKLSEMLGGNKPIRTRVGDKSIRQWVGFTLDVELLQENQQQL